MIHGVKRLAKRIGSSSAPSGNDWSIAFGVVATGGRGQVQVKLNGQTVAVPAFNPVHTQSVAAGTPVMVLVSPKRLFVMAAYPTT